MPVSVVALVVGLLCSDGAFARERLNLHLAFAVRTPLYGSLAERFVAEVKAGAAGRLRLRVHEPGALDAGARAALDAACRVTAACAAALAGDPGTG